jgi:FlaA1/EpsC-like NDP-sugar epimerase
MSLRGVYKEESKALSYFAEKRILVTGASSGIGRTVATWFSYFIEY